jgi:histidine ammonia-lyase
MTTAIKTRQIIENSWFILAIELMSAAQAVEYRLPAKPSPVGQAVHELVRKHVKQLEEDRPLYDDINNLTKVCKDNKVLDVAEKIVGKLK